MKSLAVTFALIAITGACAAASWNTAEPAKTFTYRGKPVHPECVSSMEAGEGDTIDLARCTTAGKHGYRKVERRDGGFRAEGREMDVAHRLLTSYRVLANNGATFLIDVRYSGGGTGIFDSLQLVELSAKSLRLGRFIAGGDRCYGGLVSAKVANDRLTYSANATPLDVIYEHTGLPHAYENLNSASVSCIAVDNWDVDLGNGKARRISLTLTGSPPPASSGNDINACFNRLYDAIYKGDEVVLKPEALAEFRKTFFETCGK